MKIAVTSKAFAKNETLKSELQSFFPDCRFNTSGRLLNESELIAFLSDCDGAIIAMEQIQAPVLDDVNLLKVIAKFGVGLNNIDLSYCQKNGIPVKWTAGVNRQSVAEMALGFMLMLIRNLYTTSNQLKKGEWNKSGGQSLYGKTIGIIGMGHIGKELTHLLKPFACRILANDVVDINEFCEKNGVVSVDKETIYAEADIISLHTPLNASTLQFIDATAFHKMTKKPIFINTARGELVNLQDLHDALLNGQLYGAAIDVYDVEPPTHKELLSMPNLVCTPHIGGNSAEATLAMGRSAISHLVDSLLGAANER